MPARHGTYPRQKAEARRKAWVRKNRLRLAVSFVPFLVGSLLLYAFWREASVPVWAIVFLFPAVAWGLIESTITGTYHLESAAMAEGWTATELRGLGVEGGDSVDYIPFYRMDIDHVLVHPAGVYAIDTKYTDRDVDLRAGKPKDVFSDWTSSALESAHKIDLFLNKAEHRFHVKVTPLVVVWGSALEGELWEGDVQVVRGVKLLEHLRRTMPLPKLDPFKQEQIIGALQSFNDKRDAHKDASG